MLAYPAALLNVDLIILDPLPNAPAKQVVNRCSPLSTENVDHIHGSFSDADSVSQLASLVDILTVEIEHINAKALQEAQQRSSKLEVHPSPSTLQTIQDKLIQKQWLRDHSVAVAPFLEVEGSEHSVKDAGEKLGYPFMLKSRTLAYDGRGNYVVKSGTDAQNAINALGAGADIAENKRRKLYAEKWVPFRIEVAVMVVRGKDGEIRSYPPVETVHRDSICHLVYAPLRARDSKVSDKPSLQPYLAE
jgi:phosphoribosylaminoimidazole carboxylase